MIQKLKFDETIMIASLSDSAANNDKSRLFGWQFSHDDFDTSTEIIVLLKVSSVAPVAPSSDNKIIKSLSD